MNGIDFALIVIGFVGLVVVLEAGRQALFGPDPDLGAEPWDPYTEPMCRCGVRNGALRHRHASWTERAPR